MKSKLLAFLLLVLSGIAVAQCTPTAGITCTPNANLSVITVNTPNWGGPINGNATQLDSIFGGSTTVPGLAATTITGSNVTATALVSSPGYSGTSTGGAFIYSANASCNSGTNPSGGTPAGFCFNSYGAGSMGLWDGNRFAATAINLIGTTGTITGTSLSAGQRDTGTASVTGAAVGMPCVAAATDGTDFAPSNVVSCDVTSSNTVTVSVTAIVGNTPASKAFNVRVFE